MDPVNPASLPPEFWSSLDPYTNPDSSQHHHSHPPQQQSTSQQPQHQPLGISWDHPALHSQSSHRDSAHGLYQSATPQSWQQNPLHHQPMVPPTPQDLGISSQYRQVPQYAQGQVTFDSRAVAAPDNAHYQSYSFSPNFYTPQHIPIPDAFPQTHSPQPSQQSSRPASYQPQPLHQNSLSQYTITPGFPDDPTVSIIQATPVLFFSSFYSFTDSFSIPRLAFQMNLHSLLNVLRSRQSTHSSSVPRSR